jgi:3-dehydroquinate dehydratase-1
MERLGERAIREGSDLVEFRLDSLADRDSVEIVRGLSSFAEHCIITARPDDKGAGRHVDGETMLKLLREVEGLRPAYFDIELTAAVRHPSVARELKGRCRQLIVSWHDWYGTPPLGRLREKALTGLDKGDICKLVTMARRIGDNGTVLSLYREGPRERLVAFCMGVEGRISRLLCLLAGSPITYACLDGMEAAPGQLSLGDIRGILESLG